MTSTESNDFGSPKPLFSRAPGTRHSDPSSSDNDTAVDYAHKERGNNAQDDNFAADGLTPVDTYQTYEEHGAPIDNTKQAEQALRDYEHHKHLFWYRVRYTCRDAFAEFCGTMIMIIFGDGSVAQVTLSANPNLPASSQNKGDYQSISWGWGEFIPSHDAALIRWIDILCQIF